MAMTREEFFEKQAKGSLWDVAVSIKRGNPLPLDADSIFKSYADLEAYAADVLAYPGQLVSVVNADSTSIYYLDQNLAIQPVGVIPSGDNKTIEVTTEGAIGLLGAKDAANGTIPMIDSETGKMVWKTLEDIGAGDGNDNTTYEFAFANEKITITPKFNGIAQNAIELDLSLFATADDLATAREEISAEIDADVKVAKDRADEAYALAESKVDSSSYATDKKALEDEDAAIREIAEAAKARIDTFLDEEGVADVVDSLHDLKVELDKLTDATELADALANKADKSYVNDELAKKQDVIAENTYDEYGAAAQAKADAIADAEGKIATAKQEVIDDAAGKYATTGALSQLETDLDARLDELEAYDHSAYATKEELTPISTAASNAQIAVSNLEDRFDEIVAVGGEPNAINKIQVNGSELIIENKTVNISVPVKLADLTDGSSIDARITEAKKQADKGVADAGAAKALADENKANLETLDLSLQLLDGKVATNITDITTLKAKDTAHDAQFTSLNELVTENGKNIAALTAGKVDKSTYETDVAKIVANEQAIATIKSTYATNALIGEVEAGKTVVQMIEEAKTSATYDDSEIRALITNNGENINKNATNIATLAEKVDSIANVIDFKGVLDSIPSDNSEYKNGDVIIVNTEEYVFNGEEWVSYGNASATGAQITALSNDIASLNNKIGEVPEGKSLMSIINNLADGTSIIEKDGKLSVNEVSTDLLVPGTETLYLYGGSSVVE